MSLRVPFLLSVALLTFGVDAAVNAHGSYRDAEQAMRKAIVERNAREIARFVAKEGIPCDDNVIPRQTVLRDMDDQGSDLSKNLFGSGGLSSRLQDVEGSGVKYREPFDTPDFKCALYGDGAEICMRREPQGWFLSDSLYRCT